MNREARPQTGSGLPLAHSGSLHTNTMGMAAVSDRIIASAKAPYLPCTQHAQPCKSAAAQLRRMAAAGNAGLNEIDTS